VTLIKVLALVELLGAVGAAALLYLVFRAYLWRTYYKREPNAVSARCIDRNDKVLALIFALVLGGLWVISIPCYLIWRYRVMNQRRRVAGLYADRMVRRFQQYDESYVEEYDESR
jgi:hypothetical protein